MTNGEQITSTGVHRASSTVEAGESPRAQLGAVRRAAVLREAGPRARVAALRVRRMLDGMGIESVDLLHLAESSVPDALALAGGLSAVGPLDLIVALTPQVEVDAARVAVQAGAPLVRLRHAHPTTTLRRILQTGHVATYTTLSVDIDDQEHVVVDHVVVQSGDGCFGVRVDDRPLPSAELVQVVASNPLAGLPRSPGHAGSVDGGERDRRVLPRRSQRGVRSWSRPGAALPGTPGERSTRRRPGGPGRGAGACADRR